MAALDLGGSPQPVELFPVNVIPETIPGAFEGDMNVIPETIPGAYGGAMNVIPETIPGAYGGAMNVIPETIPGAYAGAMNVIPETIPGAYGGAMNVIPETIPGAFEGAMNVIPETIPGTFEGGMNVVPNNFPAEFVDAMPVVPDAPMPTPDVSMDMDQVLPGHQVEMEFNGTPVTFHFQPSAMDTQRYDEEFLKYMNMNYANNSWFEQNPAGGNGYSDTLLYDHVAVESQDITNEFLSGQLAPPAPQQQPSIQALWQQTPQGDSQYIPDDDLQRVMNLGLYAVNHEVLEIDSDEEPSGVPTSTRAEDYNNEAGPC